MQKERIWIISGIARQLCVLIIFFLGILVFTSCNKVKEAYRETFKDHDDVQKELIDVFNMKEQSADPSKELKINKKLLLDQYAKILETQFPQLTGKQKDSTLSMIGRGIDQWSQDSVSLLFQQKSLAQIEAELYKFLNTEEIMVYPGVVFIEHNRVRLTAINPARRQESDWYWYETKTGKWRKESPIKLTQQQQKEIEAEQFSLRSMHLATTAHTVLNEALKRLAEIEGAETPTTLTYFHHPHKQYWYVMLQGARADYILETDKDGKVTRFERR